MKRKTLLLMSVALSLLGIAGLFFLKPDVSPQSLQLTGRVVRVTNNERISFLQFVPDDFMVVSFSQLDISPGNYTLVGRLQQYRGRVEFVVESYD